MPEKLKTPLWVLTVYALSFLCYLPMLLQRSGAAVPGALLALRYLFILIPALVSAVFLAREHAVKSCWCSGFRKISAKELSLCIAVMLAGLLTTCGYSLWQDTGLFHRTYPSLISFISAAAYLFATALAEELAWRGFLLGRIAAGRKTALSAGAAGAVWAIWHIPMWTIRNELGLWDVAPLLIWTILVSLVLGIAFFRFENLLSASLLHMIFNVCFLAPAGYNIIVLLTGIIICYIMKKYKKGFKEL